MTFDFWVAAEKWYGGYAGVTFGLAVFVVFAMCFALSRWKTKGGRRFLTTGGLIAVGLTVFLIINNKRYEPYLEPASHVTPTFRNQEFKLFKGYQPIPRSRVDLYRRLHDPEGVIASGLYEEKIVTEPVTYLGKSGRHYFFDYQGQIFRQYETSVFFDPTAEQTQVEGRLFHVKNPEFETIGFHDTPYTFYDRIIINEEDTKKAYHPEDEGLVPNSKKVFQEWTFKN